MDIDIKEVGEASKVLIEKVGRFIAEQRLSFSSDAIESKGLHDLVSFVDKQAEEKLVEGLSNIIPGSGFIAEENTATHNNEEYLWIVDPLDGTTNFIHNVRPHAVSVALQRNKKTILGIVYEIGAQEMFYSWDGIDAFCNADKIQVSESERLEDALVAAGMPVNDFSRLSGHLKVVEQIVLKTRGLRRHGSAASDLAYVAAGRFCGFYEYGLSPWDVAAGAYLVEKAGGRVTDFSGGDNYLFGREMCSGNPQIQTALYEIVKKHM